MGWIVRSVRGAYVAVAGTVVAIAGAAPPASAADEYVKYYAVTPAYEGKPENLTEIATRFLGDGARSTEILNLNSGRRQPDQGRLTDPSRLNAGWLLAAVTLVALGAAVLLVFRIRRLLKEQPGDEDDGDEDDAAETGTEEALTPAAGDPAPK